MVKTSHVTCNSQSEYFIKTLLSSDTLKSVQHISSGYGNSGLLKFKGGGNLWSRDREFKYKNRILIEWFSKIKNWNQ